MRTLNELEKYIIENYGELIKECAHLCSEESSATIALRYDGVYEGCDYCLISSALDHLNVPSISINRGGIIEYALLSDAVVEVLEDGVVIYSRESIQDRINDLILFGILSEEEAKDVLRWISNTL